ncbi:MAG: glycoside hydrolase [Bacteroidales bacterium]|nr:glycoside hydrolase [Bacteroidales bacterium]
MKTLIIALLASFITSADFKTGDRGVWIAYREDVQVGAIPSQVIARIAADSKYWLWINGEMAVFEGGLKRGPAPNASYVDEVDISPYLQTGKNRIAVLQCYFGKSGFSHLDSGQAAFYMSAPDIKLETGPHWKCKVLDAYSLTDKPLPNYRLSEPNILYDARKSEGAWRTAATLPQGFAAAKVLPDDVLGELVPRPIPQWKNFGIKPLDWTVKAGDEVDTLICKLPYNMQMTPIISVDDPLGGSLIKIQTDHAWHGKANNVRAEYITRAGRQSYESFGWMNGEQLLVITPRKLRVLSISCRETGYNSDFCGSFNCSDPFVMKFWQKAKRTLYVNMRDTFFDCPDRERAQWWGDAVLLSSECFYTMDCRSHALVKKGILELCNFQAPGGELHSPVPGNYKHELPCQMLATVGRYGIWNYYMNTGDKQTLEYAYPHVQKYLSLWSLDSTGLTEFRKGGWTWGDWGENKDIRLLEAGWHYLALEAAANMADELGKGDEAAAYRQTMTRLAKGFNACWDGKQYRHPDYTKETDDRVNALAVLCGIADKGKYPAILKLLKTQENASPYMEKYVMEALFKMGEGEYAMERFKKRFGQMVSNDTYSTLWEGWEVESSAFGGGTTNHAWSGGALIVIASQLFGLTPAEPGWTKVNFNPQFAGMQEGEIIFKTVKGSIKCSFSNNGGKPVADCSVPAGVELIKTK